MDALVTGSAIDHNGWDAIAVQSNTLSYGGKHDPGHPEYDQHGHRRDRPRDRAERVQRLGDMPVIRAPAARRQGHARDRLPPISRSIVADFAIRPR